MAGVAVRLRHTFNRRVERDLESWRRRYQALQQKCSSNGIGGCARLHSLAVVSIFRPESSCHVSGRLYVDSEHIETRSP